MNNANEDLCEEAFRAFAQALASYLRRNAPRTISIASLTGQDKVKVSVRALMREHDPSTGFSLFMEVLSVINECGLDRLRSKNINVKVIDDEIYFEIPLNVLRRLKDMNLDDLINYFKQ